jgi:hypothetical protein
MDKRERKYALAWDDDAFRARVAALAKMQDRPLEEVCITAGLAHDALQKTVRKGRNISTIFAIARSLHVDPSVLMFEGNGAVPTHVGSAALRRLALLAHVSTHLYLSLGQSEPSPGPEIERVMRLIMSIIEPDPEPLELSPPAPES